MNLTEKQRRFADEYIVSANAYRSCIKAGYSIKYAKARSHEMLDNVGIKAYIDKRLDELKSEKIAEQKEILEYLTSVMRGEKKEVEVVVFSKGKASQEIKLVKVPVSHAIRVRSAELLGKCYGLWTENPSINLGIPVFIYDMTDKEIKDSIDKTDYNKLFND